MRKKVEQSTLQWYNPIAIWAAFSLQISGENLSAWNYQTGRLMSGGLLFHMLLQRA
jgi:hypothetical protein